MPIRVTALKISCWWIYINSDGPRLETEPRDEAIEIDVDIDVIAVVTADKELAIYVFYPPYYVMHSDSNLYSSSHSIHTPYFKSSLKTHVLQLRSKHLYMVILIS